MTDAGVTIRPAEARDAASFLDLVDALAAYERLPPPDAAARERLVRDGFEEPRRFRPLLAELDGRPIGYAITFQTYSSFLARPTLYLEDLFILEEGRRRGVGTAFFRYLAGEAVRQGCGRMDWVVLDWNRTAIDFYEKLGGRRLSEWQTYRLEAEDLHRIAADR